MPIRIADVLKPKLTPVVLALKKFLDSAPVDSVYATHELVVTVGIGSNSVLKAARMPEFSAYRYRFGKVAYWGNPRAIAALRKAMAK